MKKAIYTFLGIVIMAIGCSNGLNKNDLNQTGLLDQNGNVVKGTLVYTNVVKFKTNIPSWATNESMGKYSIETTEEEDDTTYEIIYETNYVLPNMPESPTDYYKLRVPWAGGGNDYVTVSYKDINTLKKLWLDQIMRKGAGDGRVFAIRNRENNRDINNFQNKHGGRYDYYYFKDNGDIVYKGGDKNDPDKEYLVKRFVGATIVDYRKVEQRSSLSSIREDDKINYTGEYTVGAIYKMCIDVNQARKLFATSSDWSTTGACDGTYDFIAARKEIWFFKNIFTEDKTCFVRQFYNTNFLEVLVLNPHGNEGNENCLGLDGYYAYYGDYRNGEGAWPIKGFTEQNMPYMTDEFLYIGKRPEWIVPVLNHTVTYMDWSRNWNFLAMPGHRY